MTNTPSDWYPDPSGRHEKRFWDGTAWTHDVADEGRGSSDPLATRGRQKPVLDVHGSALLVGGLRKYLLWGPIVAGVGMGVFYAGSFADDPSGWFLLGGLTAIVGWIVSVIGIVQMIDGVWELAPLVEAAARVFLGRQADTSESWLTPPES